jgi:hypothetical protein
MEKLPGSWHPSWGVRAGQCLCELDSGFHWRRPQTVGTIGCRIQFMSWWCLVFPKYKQFIPCCHCQAMNFCCFPISPVDHSKQDAQIFQIPRLSLCNFSGSNWRIEFYFYFSLHGCVNLRFLTHFAIFRKLVGGSNKPAQNMANVGKSTALRWRPREAGGIGVWYLFSFQKMISRCVYSSKDPWPFTEDPDQLDWEGKRRFGWRSSGASIDMRALFMNYSDNFILDGFYFFHGVGFLSNLYSWRYWPIWDSILNWRHIDHGCHVARDRSVQDGCGPHWYPHGCVNTLQFIILERNPEGFCRGWGASRNIFLCVEIYHVEAHFCSCCSTVSGFGQIGGVIVHWKSDERYCLVNWSASDGLARPDLEAR